MQWQKRFQVVKSLWLSMHKRQQNPVNTKKWHEEVTINFQHFQHTLLISQLLQKFLLFHRNMLINTLTLERLPHNLSSLCSVCAFTWSDFYSSSFTFKLFLRWIYVEQWFGGCMIIMVSSKPDKSLFTLLLEHILFRGFLDNKTNQR